ncbi:uncharacterized protein LOC126959063 isoform X1 [Macaca thibetana thibetana]|uniref:uncharacterized protein LOC126959063 isoform X1 n=1 Tax=Macaca thibetana thibetana TaxID=257877 RepID=UPI0021BC6235|nr:uncharacterized protein LOC126959063 isoform X1 [Macaca thibetana thibetana]
MYPPNSQVWPCSVLGGLVAERAQGALRLRRASVLHGTNHIGPWRMLNLEEDLYWTQWPWASVCQSSAQPQCTEDGALPDALVSCIELCELFCPADPLALTDIDGDPGGRIPLGLLALTQCPSAGCSAPDKLKLWPFLMPWSPAQSSVSSSAQVGPLTLTHIGGEPRGRLVLGSMSSSQCPKARCPAPGVLKLGTFLVTWSPALTCVSSSTQAGHAGIERHRSVDPAGAMGHGSGHVESLRVSLQDRRVSLGSRLEYPPGMEGLIL